MRWRCSGWPNARRPERAPARQARLCAGRQVHDRLTPRVTTRAHLNDAARERRRENAKVRVSTLHRPPIDPWWLVTIGLPGDAAREIATRMQWRHLPRGALISARGAPADAWCHVHSGLVASAITLREAAGPPGDDVRAADDDHRISQLYGRGAWFGEAALVEGARRPLEYRCIAPSVIGFMAARDFHAALAEHPYFARYLLNLVSHRAARTLQRLLALKHASPTGRVMCMLAHLCEALDESSAWSPAPALSERFEVEASQAVLARACDVSRTRLNGVLGALAAAGFVEAAYGRLAFLRCTAWRRLGERLRGGTVFDGERPLSSFIDLLRDDDDGGA